MIIAFLGIFVYGNFVRFAEKCRLDAPFTLAQAEFVPGGGNAVSELLALFARLRDQ
jgi:hypothetical protein